MKVYCYLLNLFTLGGIQGCALANSLEIAEQEYPDRPIMTRLFNGLNLSGWYTYIEGRDRDPKKIFKVANGAIRTSDEEWGCITTDKPYAKLSPHCGIQVRVCPNPDPAMMWYPAYR